MRAARNVLRQMVADGDLSRDDAVMAWQTFAMLGEDSPEALSSVLDAMGLDGLIVFDMWDGE